ncbi:FecR family protein [Paraglaciecola marina]|uniref:FecR family protein n=1 Tax=Paraglaciecola marina TaxID=2500157 RepID=UPI00105F3267|nr:FecR domain-containing protein [Paraglaciecola marina]
MRPEILEQAAQWLDQETELTTTQQTELKAWLQTPEHAAAYDKMQKLLNSEALAEALRQPSSPRVIPINSKPKSKITLAIAASVALIFGLSYMIFLNNLVPIKPIQTAALSTPNYHVEITAPIAKRTSSLLEDGSHVHLNANSVLSVSQTKEQRFAALTQGQVFFDIAPDKNRPFVIDAGDSEITVLGTSFDVERTPNYTSISVYEGVVKVKADKEITLTKGQGIRVESGQIISYTDKNHQMLPLWRTGWLEVTDAAITDVATQLQAYLEKEIILEEPITSLRINGRFALDRPEESLMLISKTNQLELHNEAQRIVLRSKK